MNDFEHVNEDCQCAGKRCIRCQEVKCYGHFGFRSKEHIHLKSYCRPCDGKRGGERVRQQRIANAIRRRKEHPEKAREATEKYRQSERGKEVVKNSRRAWYRRNPEKHIAQVKEYQQSHPEKVNAQYKVKGAKTRAKEAQSSGSYTVTQWLDLKAFYGNMCLCCGRKEPEIKLTPDHIVPFAKQGSNDISNIQPLCLPCNCKKHTKIIDYRPNREERA